MSDDAKPNTSEEIFRLIYRSRSCIPQDARNVQHGNIFRVARPHNTQRHISGALMLYGDLFVQALEGPEEPVRELYEKISKDPRHELVEVIESGPVPDRVFRRWAMAMIAEHGESDIPLIADSDGVKAAAPRATTPEQEKVLDVMRDSTRGFGRGY